MINLRFLASWGPPERVATPAGPIDRRVALVLGTPFWNAWKLDREGMKQMGVSVWPGDQPGQFFAVWNSAAGAYNEPPPRTGRPRPAIPLHPELSGKLLPWQPEICRRLATSLVDNRAALDACGTGVGKTTAAIASARTAGLGGLQVLCPLNVIGAWEDWGARLGLCVQAINYEKAIRGVDRVIDRRKKTFFWRFPASWGLVVDEAHRVGGLDTLNSRMIRAAVDQRIPTLLLSATIADSPLRMSAAGELLGLFRREEFWDWAAEHGCSPGKYGWEFSGSPEAMTAIRRTIFDVGKGVRLSPSEIPGFPEASVQPMVIDVGPAERVIADHYRKIGERELSMRVQGSDRREIRRLIHEEWKAIELAKLPAIVEAMTDAEDEGCSVILFVRFRDSAFAAQKMLGQCGIVIGEQPIDERHRFIRDLQEDRLRRMVATIDCGNEAISLHDITGRFPRWVGINPGWSSSKNRQAVGRGWRAGQKSKAIIRFMLARGTDEMDLAERMSTKLNSLDALTDVDFVPGKSPDTRALLAALEGQS